MPAGVQEGTTALHAAALNGHLGCLQLLLVKGAAVDQQNKARGARLCPAAFLKNIVQEG
jgi:ankyrin repeat protein